jgi:hypothetical protein
VLVDHGGLILIVRFTGLTRSGYLALVAIGVTSPSIFVVELLQKWRECTVVTQIFGLDLAGHDTQLRFILGAKVMLHWIEGRKANVFSRTAQLVVQRLAMLH